VRDLPILTRATTVIFRRLKGWCDSCRKVRLEACDFISKATPHLTARHAYWLHRLCEIAPVAAVSRLVGASKMTLWRADLELLEKAFENYLIPDVTHLTCDEVYAQAFHNEEVDETRDDRFFTIITDLITRKVIWVEKSRRREALDKFFKRLGVNRCSKIQIVASDEHEGYASSIAQFCPNATHVLDRFHLVKNFEEAINDTRKLLYKMLPQKEVRKLGGGKYRYLFLKKADRRTEGEQAHMAKVMKDNEAFYRLELIKERMLTIFDQPSAKEARKVFDELGDWIWEAGFPPLKAWWKHIEGKWKLFSNYFEYPFTSALSEGINNVIKALKRRCFGFSNLNYFRLKILQVCGFLNSKYRTATGNWTSEAKLLMGITK
jgi:transposase